ncbi:hypothetical protein NA78x_006210 [Anatilimnocola sp. NA78]|uniref:hypothetical protein n=1 Tax=Anatilimnocola sp. NA78 TaxID=3415683 RepID=UPI003CE4AAE6
MVLEPAAESGRSSLWKPYCRSLLINTTLSPSSYQASLAWSLISGTSMLPPSNSCWLGSLFVLACALVGCGPSGPDVSIPSYNSGSAGSQAIKLFDANQNGTIEAAELSACPGVQAALPRIDLDGNGQLTASEIGQRVAYYGSQPIGVMPLVCKVVYNGRPLPNASVTFVPEEFFGGAITSASGTTDANGSVSLQKEGLDFPALQLGMYRVQVSAKNPAGAESIPSQFNTNTTLGAEVAPDAPGQERGLVLELKAH